MSLDCRVLKERSRTTDADTYLDDHERDQGRDEGGAEHEGPCGHALALARLVPVPAPVEVVLHPVGVVALPGVVVAGG